MIAAQLKRPGEDLGMQPSHLHHPSPANGDHQYKYSKFIRLTISRFLTRASKRTKIVFIIVLTYIFWFFWSTSSHPRKPLHSVLNIRHPSDTTPHQTPRVSRDVLERLSKLEKSFVDEDDQEDDFFLTQQNPDVPLVESLPETRQKPSLKQGISSELDLAIAQKSCPAQLRLGLPCGFVLAGFVGEQETKAQIHAHQLGLLALSLNRTLVLPQVGKGRMGSCSAYPFDLYYEPDALERLGVPTITHAQFLIWAASRKSRSARFVSISDSKQTSFPATNDGTAEYLTSQPEHVFPLKPDKNFCINKKKLSLSFDSFPPLVAISPERWYLFKNVRDRFAKKVMDVLCRDRLQSKVEGRSKGVSIPEVLVFNYELRHPLVEPKSLKKLGIPPIPSTVSKDFQLVEVSSAPQFQRFPYASVWDELSSSMIKQLPPLITIQWRQETIPVDRLELCIKSLLETLSSIKKSFPSLELIYLSSDYPIEFIRDQNSRAGQKDSNSQSTSMIAHSGTFSKLLTDKHHEIMKELVNSKLELKLITFSNLVETLNLSDDLSRRLIKLPIMIDLEKSQRLIPGRFNKNFNSDNKRNEDNRRYKSIIKEILSQFDSGLIGVLEKLISIKSNCFLTGFPNECSKSSSFTRQIVEERLKIIETNGGLDGDHSDFIYESLEEKKSKVLNLVEYWTI